MVLYVMLCYLYMSVSWNMKTFSVVPQFFVCVCVCNFFSPSKWAVTRMSYILKPSDTNEQIWPTRQISTKKYIPIPNHTLIIRCLEVDIQPSEA